MADIKLFNINGKVKEYKSGNVTHEKEMQTVIENNMETFFRWIWSWWFEYRYQE